MTESTEQTEQTTEKLPEEAQAEEVQVYDTTPDDEEFDPIPSSFIPKPRTEEAPKGEETNG